MGRAYMIGRFLIENPERAVAAVCLFLLASAASIGAQYSQRQAEAPASGGGKMQFQINSTATSAGAETVGTGSYPVQKTDGTVKFAGYSTRGFPKEPAPLYLIFSYISCPIQGMPLFLSGMHAGDSWSHVTDKKEKAHVMLYPAVQISGQDRLDLKGVVLAEVGAHSKKGFNYPYYLYVPDGVERGRAVHILAETNNTGRTSDDFEVHRRRAARLAADSHATKLARSLNVPLLVPVFPRPRSQWQAYTHSLDEDTLLIKTGPLKRIDLQLVKMIADARALLARSGLNVREKVFMHGFSASGTFTNRFPILHPDIVQAVASGGVNGIPTFPASRWKDTVLPYPVGIADLKHITGIEFDKDAYRQVRQYIYMGSLDRNDTTMSRDCFSAEHVDLIWSLIGKPMDKRWETSKSIYRELGVSAQLVTYISSTQRFKGFMVRLTPEQFKDMVPGKRYTILPQNKSEQYTWQAKEGVALARP